jgi:hypothetical protein
MGPVPPDAPTTALDQTRCCSWLSPTAMVSSLRVLAHIRLDGQSFDCGFGDI